MYVCSSSVCTSALSWRQAYKKRYISLLNLTIQQLLLGTRTSALGITLLRHIACHLHSFDMRSANTLLGLLSLGLALISEHALAHPLTATEVVRRGDDEWLSPQYTLFRRCPPIIHHMNYYPKHLLLLPEAPLAIPSVINPLTTHTNTTSGEVIDFFQISIQVTD